MYLSHISTLEEAAAYLSEKTGDSWTPKSVLDFALAKPKQSSRKPAPIAFAAMPIGTVFGRYEFTSPGGMVRKGSARWQLVPLYPIHAAQLIAAGNTFAGLVESPDDDYSDGVHYALIEPLESEHEINLGMVRLKRAAIESILKAYSAATSSGAPESAEPPAPVAAPADNDAELAALFDPVKTAQLESMFPSNGNWKKWAERADRNGLKDAAKDGRAMFNPYRAAIWWLAAQGPKDWKSERCFRVLANNLPKRSIDSKHRLTGEYE